MSEQRPTPRPPARVVHLRMLDGREAQEPREHGPDGPDAHRGPLDLDEAYRRYASYVAAVAIRIVGNDDELDDLVQDVFLDAIRGIAALREPAAIKGWLARITVRVAVRRLRRRALLRALLIQREEPSYELLASPDASPEQRAQVARVYRALEALPAVERVSWVLRHVQGETLEQAAVLCDCSLSTYQRRLRRATERLQRELPHE